MKTLMIVELLPSRRCCELSKARDHLKEISQAKAHANQLSELPLCNNDNVYSVVLNVCLVIMEVEIKTHSLVIWKVVKLLEFSYLEMEKTRSILKSEVCAHA